MIIRYNKFIKENKFVPIFSINNKDGVSPEYYKITNYSTNDDGSIDVYQDVDLFDKRFTKIPFKFNKIEGDFKCSYSDLTTLENSPKEVTGNFHCTDTKITSLKFSPNKIDGRFDCSANYNLSSLDYSPKYIGRMYSCYDSFKTNSIKIEDFPLSIIGNVFSDKEILTKDCLIFLNNQDIESLFFEIILLIHSNKEKFEPLLNDKIKFHQMIMRLNLPLIKYYTSIPLPENLKKYKLLI